MKKIFYLQLIVALTCVTSLMALTPKLYSYFPDDYVRLSNVNSWLSDTNIKPQIAIFGDSRAMNGINGYIISDNFDKVETVSFTNPGQTFEEASLFYSKLPAATKTVIQCMPVTGLQGEAEFPKKKIDRLILSGYRLDSITINFILPETRTMLSAPKINTIFDSKDFLRTGLHSKIRSVVAPERLSDSAYTNRTYPYLYTSEKAPASTYNAILKNWADREVADDTLTVDPMLEKRMMAASEYLDSEGKKLCIVLMPFSSFALTKAPKEYKKVIIDFTERTGIPIFDYTRLCDDSLFYDPTHLNKAGGVVLTKQLVKDMREHDEKLNISHQIK